MSKQDMLKVQTCVLRVNIHCEGCMHKVKKKLQKVEGVYKVSIDADQGKVVVSGNADPARLIEKLEKAGKHAELWGPQMQQFPISHEQMKKFQIESLNKSNNNQKKQQLLNMKNNGFVHQLPLKKGGAKDEKIHPAKDHKSVRFDLPEDDDDDDDDDDDYDDEEDDFDDDEEDDFEDRFRDMKNHGKPLVKGAVVGQKQSKGDKGGGGGGGGGKEGKAKKKGGGGGGIDMFFKSMLKKAGGKKGKSEKSSKKGEKKKDDFGGGGGKKVGFEFGDGKKMKNDDNWSKKSGENFNFHGGKQHPQHQHHQQQQQQQAFNEMKANHKGGGGGGGRNMEMMGGMPAVAGLPAMNGGRFPGPGNPYSQQQYMAQMNQMMMMNQMNQQRENAHGHDAAAAYHHQMAYARPPPPMMGYGGPPPPMMGYGPPPPASGEYAHMFSDENTDSCGIM